MTTQTIPTRRILLLTIFGISLFWFTQMLILHKFSTADGGDGLVGDGRFYYALAHNLANGTPIPEEIVQRWGTGAANIYPSILAFIIRNTGIGSVLAFKTLNLLVCLIGVWCAGQLVLTIQVGQGNALPRSPRLASVAMIVLSCYPSFCCFGFSYSLCRDGWVYTFYLLCSLLLAKVYTSKPEKVLGWSVLFFASVIGLYFFRWYMAIMVLLVCLPIVAYNQWPLRNFSRPQMPALSKTFGFVCLVIIGCMLTRFRIESSVNSATRVVEYRNGFRDVAQNSDAEGNLGIYYTDYHKAMWPLLYGYSVASNAFGPFAWQIKNARMAVAMLEGLTILVSCCYLVAQWRRVDNRLYPLILQSIAWLMLIGLFIDNLGTAMRLRVPAIMLLGICVVFSYGQIRQHRGQSQAPSSSRTWSPIALQLFGRNRNAVNRQRGMTSVMSRLREIRGSNR